MPKIINVQGLGPISFPDSMDDAAISHAIETDILPNNIGNIARTRLASQGLTPDAVKAGQGVTSPNQIQFAPPKQMNGGFMGGLLSNPVAGIGQQVDALLGRRQNGGDQEGHGAPTPSPEETVAHMMVPDYQGIAQEAMRRGAANQSTSDMYGKATQAAAITAAGMAAGPIANRLGVSAINQYKGVVDPSGTNPLAGEVAGDMLNNRTIMRDPRTEIANYAEGRAKAADTRLNQAIDNMPQPVDAGTVAGKINATKAKLYNPETGAPIDPNADQIAAKLDAYSANHVLGNAQAFVDPDGNIVFQMDPKVARVLKQNFDAKPFGKGSEAMDAKAQEGVGNALRDTLNQDPNVASANAAVHKALNIKKDLAPNAAKDTMPSGDRIAKSLVGGALAEGIGAVAPVARPFARGAAMLYGIPSIGKVVIDVMRSPLWNTASAVTKARLASAIAANDYESVSRIAAGIAGGNQNQ